MTIQSEKKNPLETEPISRLIWRYSVPTTLTLMVNYLYNIVDQIFVGQGVGITGMAATNIAFPLTILTNAVALMLGDGCAANMSLYLGKKQQREADETVSHTVTLLILCGLASGIVCGLGAPAIVRLFGATSGSYREAVDYMRAIAWGIPFQMICPALTAVIRADGAPKYAMKCMMLGAVINLVLDPVFIFGLGMGVTGAGIATVIGQIASGLLFLKYLPGMRAARVRAYALKPGRKHTFRVLAFGFPSLLTQIMSALVQIVMNNLMTRYGAATRYGSDIALSVYGMIMKVYQISHSMFVGVSSAVQPINGFNFGAKHYGRVRKTYRMAAAISLAVPAVWFLIYQIFPAGIAGLFVSDDPLYTACAVHCFRIYMMAFFLYGLHMTTASFFQGIGRPVKALALPLSRQGVFLIPLAVILSTSYGMDGALAAAPIADTAAFALSVILARNEFSGWKKAGMV